MARKTRKAEDAPEVAVVPEVPAVPTTAPARDRAVLVRQSKPGTTKQSVKVVTGFADDVEANVFAVEVAKKHNVLLDGHREYRYGNPIVTEVVRLKDELAERGVEGFEQSVQRRRDDIALREQREREARQ